jgi:hypothetical protein
MKKHISVDGFHIIEVWLRKEALRLWSGQPQASSKPFA